MSTPMDHIAYLSQEIGPRPAGTEEEQQAALYITERLQKEAHLSAQIEDFTCNSNALMTPIICYAVAIVAVLLGIILPVIAIPATVLALAAAAIAICEALDHPILSQVFTKGVSQNIIAKYEPTQSSDAAGSRRRKVIVVANYDSGKVRRETAGVFVRALRPLRYGALGGMVVASVFMLLRGVDCDALVPDCDKDALRLCHADMIRWFLSGPSKRNNTSDSDNGWSHAGGGYELSSEDRKTLLAAANAIYSELEPGSVIGKKRTFVVNSFGVMRGKVGMIDNASGFEF